MVLACIMPPVMKTVVAYVSAHGFGHWAQMAPVLQALHDCDAGIRIVLRTALPEEVLRARSDFPFDYRHGQVDVGVVQRDALHEDIPATITAVEHFHRDWAGKVREEARLLRGLGADLVFSDIAPLAFAAADFAGIPSIAIGSIDWHAIYSHFLPEHYSGMRQIAEAHRACDLFLLLPLNMPVTSFSRHRHIGAIARESCFSYEEMRRRLGYADGDRVALVMFGGTRAPSFRVDALAKMAGWKFMMPAARVPEGDIPANVQCIAGDWDMADLVRAADVIVTKPGYGVVSEAWLAGKPMVYVPRTDFPEYPYLKSWLQENAPSFELNRSSFLAGEWYDALAAAVGSDKRYPPFVGGGEVEAAEIILAALEEGGVVAGRVLR